MCFIMNRQTRQSRTLNFVREGGRPEGGTSGQSHSELRRSDRALACEQLQHTALGAAWKRPRTRAKLSRVFMGAFFGLRGVAWPVHTGAAAFELQGHWDSSSSAGTFSTLSRTVLVSFRKTARFRGPGPMRRRPS